MRSPTAGQLTDAEGEGNGIGKDPGQSCPTITMDDRRSERFPTWDVFSGPADASSNATTTSVSAGQRPSGAPRRNRTGDPILTMEPPGTAVRTPRFPRSRPTVGAKVIGSLSLKLCVLRRPTGQRWTASQRPAQTWRSAGPASARGTSVARRFSLDRRISLARMMSASRGSSGRASIHVRSRWAFGPLWICLRLIWLRPFWWHGDVRPAPTASGAGFGDPPQRPDSGDEEVFAASGGDESR